jgi:hypothetical protein
MLLFFGHGCLLLGSYHLQAFRVLFWLLVIPRPVEAIQFRRRSFEKKANKKIITDQGKETSKKDTAQSGNRTQVYRVAGGNYTTKPTALFDGN